MTLQEIAERLERIESMWRPDANDPRILEVERLRLDVEREILRQSVAAGVR